MIFKEGKIDLRKLFREISHLPGEDRLIKISDFFMEIPYRKFSILEDAEKEQKLTIDFEGIDCMTFLEYLEALRISHNYEAFIDNLKGIRYFNGIVNFYNRRHFFSDWDTISTLKNITREMGVSFYKTTIKELNKVDEKKRLIEGIPIKAKKIDYIPTYNIKHIIDKIASVCYCAFFTSKKGLDVTHVGLIIKDGEKLILRHASSIKGKVIDESFTDYALNKEGIILYKPIFDKWTEQKK